MRTKLLKIVLLAASFLWVGACAGPATSINSYFEAPYFENPPDSISRADRELYERALFRQKNNRIKAAIDVWKQFLQKFPRSFEAHNNLGLVYYADDQLDPAIAEFETARSLEPNDNKIKKNLIRVFKLKSTLLKEARDYDGAVDYLKRAQNLAEPREKEKIGFLIEDLEDRVFEEVKRTHTLEAYQGFLERYPDSPKNSDEARSMIESMRPPEPELPAASRESAMDSGFASSEEPAAQDGVTRENVQEMLGMKSAGTEEPGEPPAGGPEGFSETAPPEKMSGKPGQEIFPLEIPSGETTAEEEPVKMGKTAAKEEPIRETTLQEKPLQKEEPQPSIPEQPKEVLQSAQQQIEIGKHPQPKPPSGVPLFPNPETLAEQMEAQSGKESSMTARKVRIITQKDPLRVREQPSPQARVLSKLKKGSLIPLITQDDGWYKVEYSAGKWGWIAKKFAEVVE
ncbi:MAG: SH3 domain-containing protein [Nitrospinaceae bacterium]